MTARKTSRVLIIGLDGATWDVLDPWMRDGTLPHLEKLRRSGCWGDLRSTLPPLTAPAWMHPPSNRSERAYSLGTHRLDRSVCNRRTSPPFLELRE